ncbi:hypothetical protein SCALIN_C18_0012 [Candidatus Scalindua japonica]|uniref:Uncharacterized protein n=2 Tax=Candidatus Scalindua japonica TaxID=1284222 RepID=A0A286TZ65_9BACT|nr:hypothetical protein SCALIN_C18_0012 [Candidatus Scalindua japonica]
MEAKSMSTTTLNKLIEGFDHLTVEDKEYAFEVVKKQLIEARREAISKKAKTVVANLKKGKTKSGTLKDLYKDLEE